MSLRTLERRLALFRASWSWDLRRVSSRRWSWRISRWRERLFCLVADAVRVASESRRRVSCDMSVSRCMVLICGGKPDRRFAYPIKYIL